METSTGEKAYYFRCLLSNTQWALSYKQMIKADFLLILACLAIQGRILTSYHKDDNHSFAFSAMVPTSVDKFFLFTPSPNIFSKKF